jgi:hypothetical protein
MIAASRRAAHVVRSRAACSRPLEFIAPRGDDGRPSLDVREAEIEQLYNVQDMYARLLFCRQHGATVYRRPRQRAVSVCVRTTVSKHNALWQRFLSLSAELDGRTLAS